MNLMTNSLYAAMKWKFIKSTKALWLQKYGFRRQKLRFYDTIFYNKRNALLFTKCVCLKTTISML